MSAAEMLQRTPTASTHTLAPKGYTLPTHPRWALRLRALAGLGVHTYVHWRKPWTLGRKECAAVKSLVRVHGLMKGIPVRCIA